MIIKHEMLKKMELRDQQCSHSMEAFQENMFNFTNIFSQPIQMMTASFNPNPFWYRQVNHYQVPYQQQTGSGTQSFADVRKVNYYQDSFYQHNQSVNSASSSGNNSQNIIEDGEKQYTKLVIGRNYLHCILWKKFLFFLQRKHNLRSIKLT